jgi:hypothetical protein
MSFEDRLRERLKRAEMQMPLARVDLQETMAGARRGLMLRYALSTVAIIVAIAGGAFAATDLFGNDVRTPAPAGSPSPEPAPSPSDSATEHDADAGLAVPAAKAWIAAMGEGDREQAWDLMTAQAKARFDTYAAFESSSGLSEGWATWAFAKDVAYYNHTVASSEDPAVVVVTIAGTRQVEGTTERSAGALVVDVEGNRALVDPFTGAGGTNIEPIGTLGDGGSLEAGKPVSLEAFVPEQAMDVYFLVAARPGRITPAQTEPAAKERVLARSVLAPLPPGNHWVTIAASLSDGSVWTRPIELEVE